MIDDSKKTPVVPAPVPAAAPVPQVHVPGSPPTGAPVAPVSDAGLESRAQPYQTVVPADQLTKTGNAAPPVALAGVPDTPPSDAPLGVGPAVPSLDYVDTAGAPNAETSSVPSELVGADTAAANGLPVTLVPQAAPKPADGV